MQAVKSNGDNIVINSKTEEASKSIMEVTGRMGADEVMDFVNALRQSKQICSYLEAGLKLFL